MLLIDHFRGLQLTGLAKTEQLQPVFSDPVSTVFFYFLKKILQLIPSGEGHHLTTFGADQEMLVSGQHWPVSLTTLRLVNLLDEIEAGEHLQGAINAGNTYSMARLAGPVINLLGG